MTAMSGDLLLVVSALVVMEPVTYLTHRFVMHRFGMCLHASHHRRGTDRFELNDLYPVIFASVTVLAMAAGVTWPSLHVMFTVGIGVTLYGMAYLFVHDLYIHRRLGRLPQVAVLDRLKAAHRIHHLYGGEPYGMLVPVVPAELRKRAEKASFDPFKGGVTVVAETRR